MLRIYLDSSDYSTMSNPRNSSGKDVLEYLRSAITRGDIEVRFSAVHVLEGAHVDASSKPMALERARLIAELSGPKCFVWWYGRIYIESSAVAHSRSTARYDDVIRNDGKWFPDTGGLTGELILDTQKALKKTLLETQLPRTQRRRILNQLVSNGRLTPQAVEMMRPGRKELLEQLKRDFPLPERVFDEDLFLGVVTGQRPKRVVTEAIEEAFSNVPTFVDWAYDKHDPERKLTKWLRDGSLMESVADIRMKFNELNNIGRTIGKSDKDSIALMRLSFKTKLPEIRAGLLWSIYEENKKVLSRDGLNKKDWQARVIESPTGSLPSLDVMLGAAFEYFADNTTGSQRNTLLSDYGDIQHMTHLPYVDIFRCDGYAAQIAKRVAKNSGTDVVGKLTDLPAAIERRLTISK